MVVEVKSLIVMAIVVIFEEDVLRLICRCDLQGGGRLGEKESFYDELKCEQDMHCAGDIAMC